MNDIFLVSVATRPGSFKFTSGTIFTKNCAKLKHGTGLTFCFTGLHRGRLVQFKYIAPHIYERSRKNINILEKENI